MNSMKVRKIAAGAVVGGALIASAVAAAVTTDTTGLESYKFFTGGSPQVKVVVGSMAQASDGVAAGNIAARLGNLAYTSDAVTVGGTEGVQCECVGGTGTGGTVSDKSVTLETTTPGVNLAAAYPMQTYIVDNLDSNADTVRNTSTQWSGSLSTGSVVGGEHPKTITKDNTQVLQLPGDGALSTRSISVKEEQKMYVYGQTNYYSADKIVRAENVKAGYEVTFNNPLPFCLDSTKMDGNCPTSDMTTRNNVNVWFLGEQWVVSDWSNAAPTSITLGKGKNNPVMKIGDSITMSNGANVTLMDVTGMGYTSNNIPRAKFVVKASDGSQTEVFLDEGASQDVAGVTIKVNKVFAGVASSNNADVSVFSDKLVLINGQKVSGKGNWKAYLNNVTAYGGQGSGIAKISLYNDLDLTNNLKAGESLPIVTNSPGFKLTYEGLQTVDTDTLTFTVLKSTPLTVPKSINGNDATTTNTTDWVKVTSAISNAFRINTNVGLGIAAQDHFYIAVKNNSDILAGDVYYYNATSNMYHRQSAANTNNVTYYYSGTGTAQLGVSNFTMNGSFASSGNVTIQVPEWIVDNMESVLAKSDPSSTYYGNVGVFNILYDQGLQQFVNTAGSTTVDKLGYVADTRIGATAPNTSAVYANQEAGFTSQRGSKITSVGTSTVGLTYAKSVAHGKYTLYPGSAAAGSANTKTYVLKEGESADLGSGYSVKVKSIDVTSAGGTCGSTPQLSGLDQLTASGDTVTPLAGSLVVMDKDASDTEQLVVVGGPMVDSVAARVVGADGVKPGDSFVKVSGNKVLVMGYTAEDTKAAADALVAWLDENRDTVRTG